MLNICLSVCVFTVLWGIVGRSESLLVSNCTLQQLYIGLELIKKAPRPPLSGFGGLTVVHPVDTTITWGVLWVGQLLPVRWMLIKRHMQDDTEVTVMS